MNIAISSARRIISWRSKSIPHVPDSEQIEPLLVKLSDETGIPLVATQDSHYLRSEDNEYHDVLLAVQTGNKLADDDRMTMKEDDFSLLSPEAMAEKFAHIPGGTRPCAPRRSLRAATWNLKLGKVLLPNFPKPEGKTANAYLRELVEERLPKKIPARDADQRNGRAAGIRARRH